MRYQIPTHFHGDINNATIFHCMENPRGFIIDSDMDLWARKEQFDKLNLNNYSYKETAKRRHEKSKFECAEKIFQLLELLTLFIAIKVT